MCGDQYISQSELGATLIATLTVQFNSHSDKTNFTLTAGAKFGSIASVSTTIKDYVQKYQIKGGTTMSALQIGGDASQLAKIFNSGPDPYAFASCSLEKMDNCSKIITGVIGYAADKFPDQIDFKNGKVFGNAEALGYAHTDFSDLGLDVGPTIINATIESLRKQLGDLELHSKNIQTYVTHLTNSLIFNDFNASIKEKIKETSNNLEANLKQLEDAKTGALACYTAPENCANTFNKIKNSYKLTVYTNCLAPNPWLCLKSHHGSALAFPNHNETDFEWNYFENNQSYNNQLTIKKIMMIVFQ